MMSSTPTPATQTTISSSPVTTNHILTQAFISLVLIVSHSQARSLPTDHEPTPVQVPQGAAKRFYIPVIMSSDVILASLRNRQGLQQEGGSSAPSSTPTAEEEQNLGNLITQSGFQRKRTATRQEYLDTMVLPQTLLPKRKMFFGPLGYMGASARIMNKNRDRHITSSGGDVGSPGFRYG